MKIKEVRHVIVPIAESYQFPGLIKIDVDKLQDEGLEVEVKYSSGSKFVCALILGREVNIQIEVSLGYDPHAAENVNSLEDLHSEIKESFSAKQKRWDEKRKNEINKLNNSR